MENLSTESIGCVVTSKYLQSMVLRDFASINDHGTENRSS